MRRNIRNMILGRTTKSYIYTYNIQGVSHCPEINYIVVSIHDIFSVGC